MKFDDFIKKYDGVGIDYDGAYGFQCMDLYRQYVKEVLGYPQSPPVPGAKDVWGTYLPDKYDRITNTPTGVPVKGDILIWGTQMGQWGHIAVFIEGNTNSFNSFDQNYPVGSKCHIQTHTYKGLLGWLHPKEIATNNSDKVLLDGKTFEDLVNKATKWDEVCKYLEFSSDPLTTQLEEVRRVIAGLKSRITDIQNQLSQSQAEAESGLIQISSLKEQVLNDDKLRNDLTKQLNEAMQKMGGIQTAYEAKIQGMRAELEGMYIKVKDAKKELADVSIQLTECKRSCGNTLTAKELIKLLIKRCKS